MTSVICALRVDDPLGDALAVALGHLLDQVMILQQDGTLVSAVSEPTELGP